MGHADIPADGHSRDALAADGLTYALVDTTDAAALAAWYQADMRGFLDAAVGQEHLDKALPLIASRRTTAVSDPTSAEPGMPVATVSSWSAQLTVPGGRAVPSWAISSVSVAPTHRRRGIARALLEGELRTAAALGQAMAMLTVSEATIYGRFGFGAATFAADLSIETKRVRWRCPRADGRLHFVATENLVEQARSIYDEARAATVGEIVLDDALWRDILALTPAAEHNAKHVRAVRYDSADGEPQGYVVYRPKPPGPNFDKHTVVVRHLIATTDAAYAALWRFILELDLVDTVTAPLRTVDEPLRWLIDDHRALHTTEVYDHLWLRILDVKAALEGRSFAASGRYLLDIDDPLGFAAGRFLLEVADDGTARVSRAEAEFDGSVTASLALGVAELSSIYLGGVEATTLLAAGSVKELQPGSARAVTAAFRAEHTPWLSTWF